MSVHYIRQTRPSGRVLARALADRGYQGRDINFGKHVLEGVNRLGAVRLAANKRQALCAMRDAGVPVPRLFTPDEAIYTATSGPVAFVGRRDSHRQGNGFFLCYTQDDVFRAIRNGVTHFMDYIDNAREFRVHVVNGKSIKLSEKHGGGNFHNGARFAYPDFDHKRTLRKVAKQAVEALGLDFGAVDVLYKDGKFYVLEVNSAPALTCERSDTLERYVRAFQEEYA